MPLTAAFFKCCNKLCRTASVRKKLVTSDVPRVLYGCNFCRMRIHAVFAFRSAERSNLQVCDCDVSTAAICSDI